MPTLYKNWNEIVKFGEGNKMLMLALATTNPDSHDSATKEIVKRFPECFNAKTETGPLPLSYIVEEALRRESKATGRVVTYCHAESYDVIPKHVPILELAFHDSDFVEIEHKVPDHIPDTAKVGETYSWKGSKFVIIENNDSCRILYLVPAECVVIDREPVG